jgi:hypothetical protein
LSLKLSYLPNWCGSVNGAGSACDQKTFKFFSRVEESMARHVGVKGSLLKVREGKYKKKHGDAGAVCLKRVLLT